jgi:uncharacterized cofD-like protein
LKALQPKYPHGLKVVALGGGTGLSTLLRGLKQYTDNITAIVTVTDTGGSSGRLRSELGVLPPGDVRDCLVALADTEPLMEQLFRYRFPPGTTLSGHSFGNLFLASMCAVAGDLNKAIKATSRILKVRGQVLPSTLVDTNLVAQYADGTEAKGETKIACSKMPIQRLSLEPSDCPPVPETLVAIREADLIILGPGSLYTSVLPNVLVTGIPTALATSGAVKVYVVNVMTEPGETDGYTAADHVRALINHGGPAIVDWVLVNTRFPTGGTLMRYREEGAWPTALDQWELQTLGLKVKEAPLLSINDMARHEPDKLAQAVLSLVI